MKNEKKKWWRFTLEARKKNYSGGNQLLSKRSEQFLPENWPSYYRSAVGCQVEDLDGNWFRDFSIMGIGTCSPRICKSRSE